MSGGVLHVLVPAHGPSPYLPQTLESALSAADAQTHITVVDDGSPGDHVRSAVAAAGRRVEYVRLDPNRGVAGAFRACVDRSEGEYTVLLGSDDLLEPSYVGVVRGLVERHTAPTMVLPGVTVIDALGRPSRPLPDRVKSWLAPREEVVLAHERLATSLLLGNWLYFPAVAWKTAVLRRHGFRQDLHTALDLDLVLRIVFAGGELAWSPQPAFRYRRHLESASSLTAASGHRFEEERAVLTWAAERAGELGWRRAALAARFQPTSRLHAGISMLPRRRTAPPTAPTRP